jgi:hypothetical protein
MTLVTPMTPAIPASSNEIETIQRRTLDGIYRAIGTLLVSIDKTYEHCGKASCARSRRCRGFACELRAAPDEA